MRPTRLQIESPILAVLYKIEINDPDDGWMQLADDRVIDFSISLSSVTGVSNGVAFGAPVDQSAKIDAEDYDYFNPAHNRMLASDIYLFQSCRISLAIQTDSGTSDYIQFFMGVISGISKNGESVSLTVNGVLSRLNEVKITSPIFVRKRGATATTTVSVEDPTNPAYVGGLINYGFWYAGGRPYEQKDINYFETDPDFKFWYSCENSIIAPEYSWFSGDNVIDEVFRIARAIGGQIYQTVEGVLKYVEPLGLGDSSTYSGVYYTITDADFAGYSEEINSTEKTGSLLMTYTPRILEPEQVIIEDKTPRMFHASETKVIDLEPQLPVYSYSGVVSGDNITATNTMVALYFDGSAVTPTIGTVTMHATKLSITITNPSSSQPMVIYSIKVKGRPLAAQDELSTNYGTYSPQRNIENSLYIQNDADASRYLRMLYDFYGQVQSTITLSGFRLDTDRYVGELVKIDSQYKYGGPDLFRIINIEYDTHGTTMDVKLVNSANIPNRQQMYIVGATYSNSDVRKVSY